MLTGSGVAYQTGYNSANYSGKLTANSVDVDGNLSTVPLWDAAALLTARAKASDSRVILTSTGAAAGDGHGVHVDRCWRRIEGGRCDGQ